MDNSLLAAVIGAAVASIGVTLAKDTKVSEFRQAWIDALREDVAEFISLVSRAFVEAHSDDVDDQKIDAIAVIVDRLNIVMYRIIMRLDLKAKDKKPDHHKLLSSLSKAQSLVTEMTATHPAFNAVTDDVWIQASSLMDTAWERVKAGEPRYRLVSRTAYSVLAICAVTFGWKAYFELRHPASTVSHFIMDAPVRVEERILQPPTQQVTVPAPEAKKR